MEQIIINITLILTYCGVALITILIEMPVICGVLRKYSESIAKLIVNVALINAITNLTLNVTLALFFAGDEEELIRYIFVAVSELIIPVIEALMYEKALNGVGKKKLIITCYIANILSFMPSILFELL